MQQIAKNIYIEDQYPGVVVGALVNARGVLHIDAPPSPEDGRLWRAALLNLDSGADRLLVHLDAHPDRTLGARGLECAVIAHEKAAQAFRSHPAPLRIQNEETGADWEAIPGLGNIRSVFPEITFSHQMTIYWGDSSLLLEHHPGPSVGAIWAILPEEKVVFIGDAVLHSQPPFLANADIPAWLETLDLLLSSEYARWVVISGRSGAIKTDAIRAQKAYLEQVLSKLEKLTQKGAPPEGIETIVSSLMTAYHKGPADRQQKYTQRLRYGLYQYYYRHYHSTTNAAGEE